MELLAGERVLWQGRPSWRAQLSFFLRWLPLALAPAIIAGILRANDLGTGLGYGTWILISLALAALVILRDLIRRYATFYAITDQRLRVRRGILSRREQTTRFDRIQNVDVRQSLFDRMLRVGTVDFDTAGYGEDPADFRFVGISDPHALVRVVAEHSYGSEERTAGL